MKSLLTVVFACFTFVLTAQTFTFEPAQSLLNDNAVATVDYNFSAVSEETVEEAATPEIEEVEDYFNIRFSANSVFGDVELLYDLSSNTDVTVEVIRSGRAIFSTTQAQGSGEQKTVLDTVKSGAGILTIVLTANNKVESKRIRL